jgi:hypothetical protein
MPKLKIERAASAGGPSKYIECVNFPWPPVVVALST